MLSEVQNRSFEWRRDAALALLLMLLAFALRIHNIGFNSLSEDESAKWLAIQEYRHGHFAGVNSEHPLMPKVLAWASLAVGEHWNRVASVHGWPAMNIEGWLRLPNVVFGATTAAILYLFCRQLMGIAGSFAAGFFWAVAPLPLAINRLVKEETPVTFFTLLACYLYSRAKQASTDTSTRRWHALSGITFGLAMASQYMLHLFGLNALAWHVAGRRGLDHKRLGYVRLLVIAAVALLLANPLILSPTSCVSAIHWLKHSGIRHTGYDFAGRLYTNLPGRLFSGVPWYFYLWLLLVKTPIPILVMVVVGCILLLRDRQSLASCFFYTLGFMQLLALSVCGAKWIRYSLLVMPFLFMAAGYAVQKIWHYARQRGISTVALGTAATILICLPILQLRAWTPYYPFYLNSIGGGSSNIARYFAPDEVSEFDTREVAERICHSAPATLRLATARPLSMSFYVERCGRSDIQIMPLYDPAYVPRKGDVIVLEPSRRFVETERFFDLLPQSGMPYQEIRVGPLVASTIYLYQGNALLGGASRQPATVTQSRKPQAKWASARIPSLWLNRTGSQP